MKQKSRTVKYLVRITVMIVAAALIILFAANNKPDPSVQAAFIIRYDLTLWYYDETLTPYLSSFGDDYFKQTGKRVDVQLVESLDLFSTINKRNIEGDGAPDLYIIDSTKLENAYLSSLAKPNDNPLYNTDHFSAKALDAAVYKDKLVAYPLSANTAFLAYNTNLIEQAPDTFDDIRSLLPVKDEANTEEVEETESAQQEPAFATFELDVSNLLYTYSFIGEHINLGGVRGDDASAFDLSSELYTDSLNYMQSFASAVGVQSKLTDYKTIEKNFVQQDTAMALFSVPSLTKLYGSGVPLSICRIPDLTDELPSKPMSQTSVICINPDSKKTADAEELAQYLTFDHADAIFETCGLLPAVKTADTNRDLELIRTIYEDSASLPKLIETENIWENLNILLRSVWDGEEVEKAQSKLNVAIYVALSTRTEQEDK